MKKLGLLFATFVFMLIGIKSINAAVDPYENYKNMNITWAGTEVDDKSSTVVMSIKDGQLELTNTPLTSSEIMSFIDGAPIKVTIKSTKSFMECYVLTDKGYVYALTFEPAKSEYKYETGKNITRILSDYKIVDMTANLIAMYPDSEQKIYFLTANGNLISNKLTTMEIYYHHYSDIEPDMTLADDKSSLIKYYSEKFGAWYYDKELTKEVKTTKVSELENKVAKRDETGDIVGYEPMHLYGGWKFINDDNTISITGKLENLEHVSEVKLEKVSKIDVESITKTLNKELSKYDATDISLLNDDNQELQATGKIKVSIKIPEGYDKDKLAIYHIIDDKVENISSKVNGDRIEFETDHFSVFVVGELKNDTNPSTGDNILLYVGLSLVLIVGGTLILKKLNYIK